MQHSTLTLSNCLLYGNDWLIKEWGAMALIFLLIRQITICDQIGWFECECLIISVALDEPPNKNWLMRLRSKFITKWGVGKLGSGSVNRSTWLFSCFPCHRMDDGQDGSSHYNLRVAVVCSSNQNRSMEAHNFLRWRQLGTLQRNFVCGSVVPLDLVNVGRPSAKTDMLSCSLHLSL